MNISIMPVSIGAIAAEILKVPAQFSVRGITSRGVFISVEDRVILFLSREKFRGPLIINLLWKNPRLERIDLSSTGRITEGGMEFDNLEIFINCSLANVWSAQDKPLTTALPDLLSTRSQIDKFLQEILSHAENELISGVYAAIFTNGHPSPAVEPEVYATIHAMHDALKCQDFDGLIPGINFFTGRGRGLTPAGDDFLLGLTFVAFTLQARFHADYSNLMQQINDAVRQRSTLISANLVECASLGEIDERLLAAYSGLLDPAISTEDTIKSILSWGSSSGVDATAGMALLLSAISN